MTLFIRSPVPAASVLRCGTATPSGERTSGRSIPQAEEAEPRPAGGEARPNRWRCLRPDL